MLSALLFLLNAGPAAVAPWQVCTADTIKVAGRNEVRAMGNVHCAVGDVTLHAREATVTTEAAERNLRVIVYGGAQFRHGHDSAGGDTITARFRLIELHWVLQTVLIEFNAQQQTPPGSDAVSGLVWPSSTCFLAAPSRATFVSGG